MSPVDKGLSGIPLGRQAELLGVSRSSLYYRPVDDEYGAKLMNLIDGQHAKTPFYGSRKIAEWLGRNGRPVSRKRVQGLVRTMGIEAVYPKRKLGLGARGVYKYPYLLRGVAVERVDQVWATDITYIRMGRGWGIWPPCWT